MFFTNTIVFFSERMQLFFIMCDTVTLLNQCYTSHFSVLILCSHFNYDAFTSTMIYVIKIITFFFFVCHINFNYDAFYLEYDTSCNGLSTLLAYSIVVQYPENIIILLSLSIVVLVYLRRFAIAVTL